jgi:protein SCO1/2
MTDISGAMPRLDFRLSQDGKPVTADIFRGKAVALYFGYTHCPDVCPTTLANLTDMLGRVKSQNAVVLFVTVDPDRDTAAVLKAYTSAFHRAWRDCAARRTSWQISPAAIASPTASARARPMR